MAKIKQITAREILNAKGNPTVEATVYLNDGRLGIASCPSGTSVGNYEASELKDHDSDRFDGNGVLNAISNIERVIAPNLIGVEATKQQVVDKIMIDLDGTQNKGKLGANAILSVSMAVAKAAAKSSTLPLFLYLREYVKKENTELKIPTPLFNILNGGKHAGDNLDFQEFIVTPASSMSYPEGLNKISSIYSALKIVLKQNNLSTLIGDEGGFGPNLQNNKEAFLYIKEAISQKNLRLGFDVFMGLDAAASNFFREQKYRIKDKAMTFSRSDLIAYYEELAKEFHLIYLEDPMAEDDWEGWNQIQTRLGQQTLIVGDDLTATNPYRLQMALDKKTIGGIIIKPNQIGTVIEALAVVEAARSSGLKITVSHRSGETNDSFIADFAVGVSADFVKFGAPVRGERVAKYNRLLEINNQLKSL
ncbi:MAG TPA: phosphopyruvate hydratase [Patescibacteria group bacterium]|nr:phosphopyruvate hydratase [Patescibacteria group bacterium]